MIALARAVPPGLADGERTFQDRRPIDVDRARRQHDAYLGLLRDLGVEVRLVEPAPGLADSVFMEDLGVVLRRTAVVARPGVASRRPEVGGVAPVLGTVRERVVAIRAPGTLEGGDVLRRGSDLFVGLSSRTNPEGLRQLGAVAEAEGLRVTPVPVEGCLHLGTGCSFLREDLLLVNPEWIAASAVPGVELLDVDPDEPWAANTRRIGTTVIMASPHVRTRRRVEAAGVEVRAVDISEFEKAEAGVSCLTLMVPEDGRGGS